MDIRTYVQLSKRKRERKYAIHEKIKKRFSIVIVSFFIRTDIQSELKSSFAFKKACQFYLNFFQEIFIIAHLSIFVVSLMNLDLAIFSKARGVASNLNSMYLHANNHYVKATYYIKIILMCSYFIRKYRRVLFKCVILKGSLQEIPRFNN